MITILNNRTCCHLTRWSGYPDGHLAFFIHELVQHLDLSSIYADYTPSVGGRPPLEPRMMVAVWVYAYAVGIRSSRKVQAALVEDVAFRFLSGNQQPAYWALNRFRTRHREALADLFVQSVHLAVKAGLVKLGHVAIDGSKLMASASKNKAMSYSRMIEEEQRLAREISDYFDACDEVDAAEDEEFGDGDGNIMPEHLKRSADRLAAIRKAKAELETEAKEKLKAEQADTWAKFVGVGRLSISVDSPATNFISQVPTVAKATSDRGLSTVKRTKSGWKTEYRLVAILLSSWT